MRVFEPFCAPRTPLAAAIRRAYPAAPQTMVCTSGHRGLSRLPCRDQPREILWHNCAGCGGGPLGAPWISSCSGCHPSADTEIQKR